MQKHFKIESVTYTLNADLKTFTIEIPSKFNGADLSTFKAKNKKAIEAGKKEILKNISLNLLPIEKVKQGEFLRAVNGIAVFIKKEYNRFTKRYTAQSANDISLFKTFKKGTIVEVNFTY